MKVKGPSSVDVKPAGKLAGVAADFKRQAK
jgi:hypothetical protein